jgi:hypothetical protein
MNANTFMPLNWILLATTLHLIKDLWLVWLLGYGKARRQYVVFRKITTH